jgi:hypothetical protein
LDKNCQIFDIFDPFAFKKFNKFIHTNSLSVCGKYLQVLKGNLHLGSKNVYLTYFPEVMAVYSKGDSQGKQPGFAQQGPGH